MDKKTKDTVSAERVTEPRKSHWFDALTDDQAMALEARLSAIFGQSQPQPEPERQEFAHSRSIAAIGVALAKAQAKMADASKNKTNPHFKNAYADLAAVWDACRAQLTDNGLAVIQPPVTSSPDGITIITMLIHGTSGEWIRSELVIKPANVGPQQIGSAITYGRRYALAAMVGVAQADDDGEAAVGRTAPAQQPAAPAAWPPGVSAQQAAPAIGQGTTRSFRGQRQFSNEQ